MDETTSTEQAVPSNEDFASSLEFETAAADSPEPEAVDTPTTEPADDTPSDATDDTTQAEPETDADQPAEPGSDAPQTDDQEQPEAPDLKQMTRAERQAYFESIRTDQQQRVEQAYNQTYQPQSLDELTQAYLNVTDENGLPAYDAFQAQMLARETVREQQAQIAEARAEVATLNMNLATDAMEVVNSISWLNQTKSDSYDKTSTEAASSLYEKLAVTKDPNTGQIIEAKMSPKEFYNAMNIIRNAGIAEAQLKGQKAAEAQLASVAPSSSTAPVSNKSGEEKQADALLDAFGRI